MNRYKLLPLISNDFGTLSRLEIKGESFFIVERPWLDNQVNVSCIPAGEYLVIKRDGSNSDLKYPDAWQICDVPGRTGIVMHVANHPIEVEGCLAPNTDVKLYGDGGIRGYRSADAVARIDELLAGETEFMLEIVRVDDTEKSGVIRDALQEKIDAFNNEHGHHEPDTNAFVYDNYENACYADGLDDALAIVNSVIDE